jgi:hypothetical protein
MCPTVMSVTFGTATHGHTIPSPFGVLLLLLNEEGEEEVLQVEQQEEVVLRESYIWWRP